VGGAGLLAALVATLFLVFLIFANNSNAESCTLSPATGNPATCVSVSHNAVERDGWIAIFCAIPVILSGFAFVSVLPNIYWDKYAGRVAAVGLLLFCVVFAVSLGVLFMPSLLLATLSLYLDRKRGAAR
jgi:hypothetical protein